MIKGTKKMIGSNMNVKSPIIKTESFGWKRPSIKLRKAHF
jgi:hypothetical protein